MRSTLTGVGTAKYTDAQSQAIESGLKQASEDLKGYLQSVRAGIQQFRLKRIAERGNQTGNFSGVRPLNRTGVVRGNYSGAPRINRTHVTSGNYSGGQNQ